LIVPYCSPPLATIVHLTSKLSSSAIVSGIASGGANG
jgi:hypothetical protein